MSVELRAPFAGPTTVLLLPNPVLENEEAVEQSVSHRLAIDGTDYTYVKTGPNRRLTLTFENQGRGKLIEVQEFYKLFVGERIRLKDWRDDEWNVIIEEAPLEFSTEARAGRNGGASVRNEQGNFDLVLVGVKL